MPKLKVLHIVGRLDLGGVETWLLQVLRTIDRNSIQMDFLCFKSGEGAYDRDVIELGSTIHKSPTTNRLGMLRFLRKILATGNYDVVHSHVHHFSGPILWTARRAGVCKRIAHSHNDRRHVESSAGLPRKIYLAASRRLVHRTATDRFAVSTEAALSLFGHAADQARLIRCGIDLSPFARPADQLRIRDDLGIPRSAPVFGTVGRFAYQKNHQFLLQTFRSISRSRPDARLLLVGDGPLRAELERDADNLGIKPHTVFAGSRRDVPALLMGAFDVFLLPSHHEGLPLVGLEAQAAGLPCIFSTGVTEETTYNSRLVKRLPLATGPEAWACAALELAALPRRASREVLEIARMSPFSIESSVQNLMGLYLS